MWASGFSFTTVNSSLSKANEDGHAGMRLFFGTDKKIPRASRQVLSLTLVQEGRGRRVILTRRVANATQRATRSFVFFYQNP